MDPKLGGINFEENNQTKISEVCRGRHHCHFGIGMQLIQIQKASDECGFHHDGSATHKHSGMLW